LAEGCGGGERGDEVQDADVQMFRLEDIAMEGRAILGSRETTVGQRVVKMFVDFLRAADLGRSFGILSDSHEGYVP
tara:strand:+ start:13093 stop:13320 length:228 start_codon:yes stop_codon:yes gene_type:complete